MIKCGRKRKSSGCLSFSFSGFASCRLLKSVSVRLWNGVDWMVASGFPL